MSNGRVKQTLSVIDEAVARLTMRANYLDQLTLQGAEPTTLERALRYVETSHVATMPPPATATRSAASSQPRTAAVAPPSNSLLSERLESLSVQRPTPAPAAAAATVHVSNVTQPRIRPAAAAAVGSQSIVSSTPLNGRIAATAAVPYAAGLRAHPGPQQEGGAFVPFGLSDNQRQQLVQSIMRDYATGAIPIHAASAGGPPTGSSIQYSLQQSTMTTTTTAAAGVADVSEIRPTSADYALLRIRAAQQQPDSSGRLLAAAVSVGGDAAPQTLDGRHDADVTQDVSRHDDEERRRYVDDDEAASSLQPNESSSAPVPTAGANVYGSTQRPSGQPRYPYTSADVSSVVPTETESVQYPHDGHSMQPRRHHHQAAQPVLPNRVHSVAPVDIAPPAISTQSIQELLSLVRQPLSSDQRASLFAIAQAGFEGIALQSRLTPTTANGTPTVSPVYRKYLNICSDQATPLRTAGDVFTAIVHLANAQQQPEERVAADARSKHHRLLSSATSRISMETASLMRELGCTVVENACDEATPAASVSPQRRGATKTSSKVLQEPAVCDTIPEQLRNVKYVSAKRRTDSVNPIVSRCASSRRSIAKRAVSSSPRRLKIQ